MIKIEKFTSKTQFIPDIKVDIGYIIRDDFYFGPDNGFSAVEWKKKRVALKKPSLKCFLGYALSEDVMGQENKLVEYYKSILTAAEKHGKSLKPGQSSFWLRPVLYWSDLNYVSFPWHDTFNASQHFLRSLLSDNQGLIFDYTDQGWNLEVFAEQDKLHFIQRDWESNKTYLLINGSRGIIASRAQETIERAKKQIAFLTKELGADYWTKRIG